MLFLRNRNGHLKRVLATHRSYDAFQYPLCFFWQATDGYHFLLKKTDPETEKTSAQDFYFYRIMVGNQHYNHLLRSKQLFNQFLVDMYAKIESERLIYIRQNWKQLRASEFIHLRDAVMNDGNARNAGQMVILPSSFTGGLRYMYEKVQDAITYVRHFELPDQFITFTCNPIWPDIQENLFPVIEMI